MSAVALRLRKNTHILSASCSCSRGPIFDLLIVVLLSKLHVKAQNEEDKQREWEKIRFLLAEIIKTRKGKFKEEEEEKKNSFF